MKLLKWTVRLIGAAALLVAVGFLVFVYSIHRETPESTVRADGIVVLTGGTERIARGIRLLATKRANRLLISGVNTRTSPAALSKRTPGYEALFNCCIDVGYKAQDTIGNATETLEWVQEHNFDSLIVVTSSYHMPRSLAELHRALPGITLHAHPVVPASVRAEAWYANPGTAKLLFWEYAKFLPAATRYCATLLLSSGASVATHADTSG